MSNESKNIRLDDREVGDPRETISDEKMLRLVLDRFDHSKDWRLGRESQWRRWYDLYRSYVDRPDWPFETKLFIPLIFSTVESFLPRLVNERPRIKIEARNQEDIDTARVHRELLEYQWDHLGMGTKLVEFVKSALIYGTAWAKIGWEKITRERTIKPSETDQLGVTRTLEVPSEVTVYNDPVIDVVSIEDIYPDPDAIPTPDLRGFKYICHRIKKELWEIEEEAESRGYNSKAVEKLREITESKISTELERNRDNRESTFGGSTTSNKISHMAHTVEFDVIEYWEDDRLAIVVHDPEVILFNDVNPWTHGRKPFVRLVDNILPGEIYGIGEPEVLESINIEMNDIHNLRMEMAKRLTFNMFVARTGAPIVPEDLKFKPHGIIWTTDINNDIKPLFERDVKSSGYREEQVLRLLAQEASGASDPFKGLEQGEGDKTATEASILTQAAASRAGLKFQLLVENALKPLAELMIALNEQNMDEERLISIVGPEGQLRRKISPQELAIQGADLDVRIDIGATDPVSKELRTQRTINGLQVLGGIPPEAIARPDIRALVKRLFDLWEIPLDANALFQSAAMGAQQAAQGPNSPQQAVGPSQNRVNPENEVANALSTVQQSITGPRNTAATRENQ